MTWHPGADLGGRYRLEEKIGEGGMGEVWRAKHIALETDFAVKFLGAQLAGNQDTLERFRHEAKITANLKSPHAVQVTDYGLTDHGEPYIVMELLNGEPLSARIERKGRLEPRKTVDILRDAAKALSKAHRSGIVHRDFKPDNVFLVHGDDGQDVVKVVDFGIAKLIGSLNDTRPEDVDLSTLTGKAHLTRTGGMVGTPHYMGPEQVRMEANIGPAADIWALGIVAFECLTGRCPFDGNNVLELFTNIQAYRFIPATQLVPSLPPGIDDWFRTVCAPTPEMRYADPLSAVDALEEALLLERVDLRPSGPRINSMPDGLSGAPGESNSYRANSYSTDPGDTPKNTMTGATLGIPKSTSRGAWVVITGVVLAAGLAAGAFVQHQRVADVERARALAVVGAAAHAPAPAVDAGADVPSTTGALPIPTASGSATGSASATASASSSIASVPGIASSATATTSGGNAGGKGRGKNGSNPQLNNEGTPPKPPPTDPSTTTTTQPNPKPAGGVLSLPASGI